MFLAHVVHLIAVAAMGIWSAKTPDEFVARAITWAIATCFLMAPFYAGVWLTGKAFKKKPKWLLTITTFVVGAHGLVFLCPLLLVPGICCVLPCVMLVWIVRAIRGGNNPQPRRRRPARRPRPEPEDEDTDSGAEEEEE